MSPSNGHNSVKRSIRRAQTASDFPTSPELPEFRRPLQDLFRCLISGPLVASRTKATGSVVPPRCLHFQMFSSPEEDVRSSILLFSSLRLCPLLKDRSTEEPSLFFSSFFVIDHLTCHVSDHMLSCVIERCSSFDRLYFLSMTS